MNLGHYSNRLFYSEDYYQFDEFGVDQSCYNDSCYKQTVRLGHEIRVLEGASDDVNSDTKSKWIINDNIDNKNNNHNNNGDDIENTSYVNHRTATKTQLKRCELQISVVDSLNKR